MSKAWAPVFLNARSTSDQVTPSISAKTARASSSCWQEETKQRQQNDIRNAIERWDDYKSRKKLGKEEDEE